MCLKKLVLFILKSNHLIDHFGLPTNSEAASGLANTKLFIKGQFKSQVKSAPVEISCHQWNLPSINFALEF